MATNANSNNWPLANSLSALLGQLRHCWERRLDEVREQAGLTSAEHSCLMALPEQGSVRANELAELMSLSPSRASRVIDRLVQRRLVLRRSAAQDRRAIELTLSKSGQALRQRVRESLHDCEETIRSHLSPKQQAQADRGVRLLLGALQQELG